MDDPTKQQHGEDADSHRVLEYTSQGSGRSIWTQFADAMIVLIGFSCGLAIALPGGWLLLTTLNSHDDSFGTGVAAVWAIVAFGVFVWLFISVRRGKRFGHFLPAFVLGLGFAGLLAGLCFNALKNI